MSENNNIHDINEIDFEEKVLNASKTSLIIASIFGLRFLFSERFAFSVVAIINISELVIIYLIILPKYI